MFDDFQLDRRACSAAASSAWPEKLVMIAPRLSNLQKQIMRIAYCNRLAGKNRFATLDVTNIEILHEHFGFPFSDSKNQAEAQFDLSKIDPAEYRMARAAVSRAFSRLVELGMVKRGNYAARYSGVILTRIGILEANRLVARHSAPETPIPHP